MRCKARSLALSMFASSMFASSIFGACECAPPTPPPPQLNIIGTGFFVGEVYVGDEPVSNATIEVAGLAARATSEAGKRFAIFPVPVGEHTISIHEGSSGRARRFKATIETQNQTVELSKEDTTLEEPVIITGRVDLGGAVSPAGTTVFVVGGTGAELATAGDDGTFTLRNAPPGPLTIAASARQPGFNIGSVAFEAVPGTQALPAAIVVSELDDPTSKTTVSGNVTAADREDHAGTLIVVDDGEEITATNSDGDFAIDVAPGHHDFVAERPGHEPVTLPTVATSEEGDVDGIVDMFVAPGNDDGGGDVVSGVTLEIEFPAPGVSVIAGAPTTFTADLLGAGGDDERLRQVVWTVAVLNDPSSEVQLGVGAILPTVLPAVFADAQLVVTASVPGADALVDSVAIVGAPLFSPDVRLGVDAALVRRPLIAPDDDGVLRVDVTAGQPVLLVADEEVADEIAGTIVWTEGAAALGTDALDLGELDVGTHLVTATLLGAGGETAALDLRVVVTALVFTIAVDEPTVGTTYFTDQALPLRASFVHPYQIAFPASAVLWRDVDNAQIAQGLVTSTRNAPTGAQLVQLQMIDVVGNERNALAEYVYTPISFTASFNTPANNLTVLEETAVTFNISFAHPTLQASDVVVTLSSSIQGTLTDDNGAVQFAPNTDIVVENLAPGTHDITARAIGGGRVASVTQRLTVDADFVTASLQVPPSVLALDGSTMRFEVVAGATPGITPRITWLVDGFPFLASWDVAGDYSASNPQTAGNAVVDFGTYDSGPPASSPFNDLAHWGPGVHTVQAWVRLPNDAAAEAGGCVNNGSISRCLSFSLTVFNTLEEKAGNGDVTLAAGDIEAWSGGILLKGSYTIDGGTLIIQPGTTVVVDMADPNNATVQDGSFARLITVNDGTLQVGAPGAVPPVRFEVRQSFVPQNKWQGIRAGNQTTGVQRTISLQNVILGDAATALETSSGAVRAPNNTIVIEDVTVERGSSGISLSCPTSFARVTFRDCGSGLSILDDALCPVEWGIDGAVFERTGAGINYASARAPQRISFTNLTFVDSPNGTDLTLSGAMDVLVADSTFTNSVNTALRYFGSGEDGSLRVERNDFVGTSTAVHLQSSTPHANDIVDNSFVGNSTALLVFGPTDDDINVHMNRFIDNELDATVFSAAIPDIDAQGNFFGDPSDTRTAAGRMAAAPAGIIPQLPSINDGIDNTNVSRFLPDNFLATAAPPLAVIKRPAHTTPYHPDLCLPLVAVAPRSDVDIDPATDCTWSLFAVGGNPAQGTPLTPDSNGCAEEAVAEGVHGVALTCVDPDGSGTTTHTTRIEVTAATLSGRITPPGLTISDDRVIDGDLIIEEGAVLTLAAGATLRFTLTDVTRHSEARLPSGRIGENNKPDIFVRGTLVAAGTAASPVTLRSDTADGNALWGGIVVDARASVLLDHTIVSGASDFIDGQQPPLSLDAPTITITNSTLSSLRSLARGSCPTLIADTTATFMTASAINCIAAGDLTIERSDFDDIRGFGSAVNIDAYLGTSPALAVEDSTFTTTANGGAAFSLSVPTTSLAGSTVDGWGNVFSIFNGNQLSIVDSTIRNFTATAFSLSSATIVQVDHSTFENGPRLGQSNLEIFVLRDSLLEDIVTPFDGLTLGGVDAFTFTGNEVRGATAFIDVTTFAGQAGISTWTVTGNNFIGIPSVVAINGTPTSMVTRIDLDGSFFGAGNDTIAEISALIDDSRTDVSPSDAIEGNTDFTGFVTSPLALDLP